MAKFFKGGKDKRIADYEAAAKALQWKVVPEGDHGMLKWLLDFKLFKPGTARKIVPLILKEDEELEHTCVFDYDYTISTGKSSHTYRQTVYFRYSKALALPHFVMVPEKWYHRIGTYFGMQDIDLVEYPAFSHNYLLQGKDEPYIRYHFDHPEMIRYFDSQGLYSMEGMNYLLVLYVHNKLLPHDQIIQLARIGNRLHDFFTNKTPDIALPPYSEG